MTLTPQALAELERLEKAATPVPVVMWGGSGWPRAWNVVANADVVWPVAHRDTSTDAEPFAVFLRHEDQRHYAALRNAAPALIAAARRLGELQMTMDTIAHVVGAVHDQSTGPSYPGDDVEVLAATRTLHRQLTAANARIAELEDALNRDRTELAAALGKIVDEVKKRDRMRPVVEAAVAEYRAASLANDETEPNETQVARNEAWSTTETALYVSIHAYLASEPKEPTR